MARALDVVGERWALLVVHELLGGPLRFEGLRRAIGGVPPSTLARRLHELEDAEVVRRRWVPLPENATFYELTVAGRELEPVVAGLAAFGVSAARR